MTLFAVCLFLVNDIDWATPSGYPNSLEIITTLAAESRLKPFFEKHDLGFQNIFSVYCVTAELRNLIRKREARDSDIARLNRNLPQDEIQIEREAAESRFVETASFESTGRDYKYTIFNFKKAKKRVKVAFTNRNLEDSELLNLGIKTKNDIDHFSSPGLEGVWFINPTSQVKPAIEASADLTTLVNRLVQEIGSRQAPAWMAQHYRPGRVLISAEREGNDSIDAKIKQAKQHLMLATQDPIVKTRAEQALELLYRHPRASELMILEFEGVAHRLVKLITGNEQAYQGYKRKLDEAIQPLYLQIRDQILEIPNRKEALRTAMIYAGIVNLLDITHVASMQEIADGLGLNIDFSKQLPSSTDIQCVLDKVYTHVVNEKTIIINELEDFLTRLEQSPRGGTILYFTDNHGEFTFDQLVIEQLLFAGYKIAVVSRGETIRDDLTRDEARALLNANPNFTTFLADGRLTVTTDGSYFLGADLTQSVQHPDFLDVWRQSIGYISKGAGNFHTLFGQRLSLPGLYIRMMKRSQNSYQLLEEARNRALPKRTPYDLALVYQPEAPVSGVTVTGDGPRSATSPIPSVQAAKAETSIVHSENLNYTPTIPDKAILCHVITDSILSSGQRNILKTLEQGMRNDKYSEKVVSLSVEDSSNSEEFISELESIKAREEARYPGYKVQFDVACPSKYLVSKIQDKGMQALAFIQEGEGDIVQVEGIILALRALQTGNIDNLLKVYKFLTGREISVSANDINELARMMLFILPVRKLDINAIGTLNRIIEENIKAAA